MAGDKMGLQKCDKCYKGFRTSKLKESLCAKCAVDNCPKVGEEVVAELEAEFNGFAAQIYGVTDLEGMSMSTPLVFNVDDVFNHKSRLLALKEQNEKKPAQSTKDRQKFSREVNRLSEETNAVQDKIKAMKNRLMAAAMLSCTVKQEEIKNKAESVQSPQLSNSNAHAINVGITNVPLIGGAAPDQHQVKVSPNKVLEQVVEQRSSEPPQEDELDSLIRSNSVRNRIKELQNKTVRSPDPIRVPENAQNHSPIRGSVVKDSGNVMSVHITCRVADTPRPVARVQEIVEKKVTPKLEEEPEPDLPSDPEGDELMPLKRSNSVRNRIQAFEALSRRASTGTWDRGASPRRKLNF